MDHTNFWYISFTHSVNIFNNFCSRRIPSTKKQQKYMRIVIKVPCIYMCINIYIQFLPKKRRYRIQSIDAYVNHIHNSCNQSLPYKSQNLCVICYYFIIFFLFTHKLLFACFHKLVSKLYTETIFVLSTNQWIYLFISNGGIFMHFYFNKY